MKSEKLFMHVFAVFLWDPSIMANFPTDRIEFTRAFLKCGIDFAGPFMIKTSLRRNAALTKGYACIFVCFVTISVHIELASGLSTQDFLHVSSRFFDKRGKCEVIYSDNATNFVDANRHLKEVHMLIFSEVKRKQREPIKKIIIYI